MNKKSLLLFVILLFTAMSGKVSGQRSITALPYSYNDNFNSYNPNSPSHGTLPSGWTHSSSGTAAYNGQGTGTSSTGGYWSYGTSGDFSLGALRSTSAGNITYTVSFTNNSGSTITSITLSWDYEQWRYANTSGFDCSGTGQLSGNSTLNSKDFTGSASGTNGTSATTSVSSFTLTGLSISDGQTFGISWVTTDVTGSDNGISIDNFSISASGSATPTITVSTTTLTGFGYTVGSGPSGEQTFTISGSDLTDDITITASTNYEISTTSGSGYTSPITLTQSGGTVSTTTIYVRLKSGLSAGTYSSENITATSTGATTKTVSCSGAVYSSEPTIQAHTITFSSVTDSSFTVGWTRGNGSNVAVFMKEGSGSITEPSDGSSYTASADWNSKGTQLGSSGYYCIYNGTGTSVAVSNLSSSTTYYVQAFEYNGSSGTQNYLTSTASGNPNSQATSTPALGWQISSTDVAYVIDFDGTVSGVNNGQFAGSGFTTSPSTGQLNSNAWAITGWSDGNLSFGGTNTSGDYARGSSAGGVTTGGIYAFTVNTGDRAFGIQPGNGDFAPGTITLRLQNQTGSTINSLDVSYDIYIYNDQGRSNSFNFSHSADNSSYTNVTSLDFTSDATAEGSPSWKRHFRSVTISGLSVANGSYYYLRWTGNDVSGSGSRDEFALDNITVIANPSSTDKLISGTLYGGVVNADVVINDNTTIAGNVTTGASSNLTINSGKTLTINSDASLTVNGTLTNNAGTTGLVVKSNSTSTGVLIHNSSVSGTVERYVSVASAGAVHYVSIPVSSATGSVLLDASRGNFNAYEWTPAQAWNRIFGSTSLSAGKGYCVAYNDNSGTKTLEFTGTLNYQDLTGVSISSTNGHWNLLGNPFTAPLSCSLFVANNSNINGAIKFWSDDGTGGSGFSSADYASWTTGGTTAANGKTPSDYIGIGQGFFVESNGNGSTVDFDADWRSVQNPTFFTPEINHNGRIWISVRDTLNNNNQILAGFNIQCSQAFDRLFDSRKLRGNQHLAFYMLQADDESRELDIQFLNPTDEKQIIWLGLDAILGGTYTFLVDSNEFPEYTFLFFHDAETGKVFNLHEQKTFSVELQPGIYEKRFYLSFGNLYQNIPREESFSPEMLNTGNQLYFYNLDENTTYHLQVWNLLGKSLRELTFKGKDCFISTECLEKGVVLIELKNDFSSKTFKTILF